MCCCDVDPHLFTCCSTLHSSTHTPPPPRVRETNSNAVVSRTAADAANKNALLATYRCQETSNRIEMKIRTTEGESGDIQATVVARTNPKVAQGNARCGGGRSVRRDGGHLMRAAIVHGP